MSLKNNRFFRRLAGALMAGAMMVTMMGMTVFAADGSSVKDNVVKFGKTLDMTEAIGASVPDVTFTYSIASGKEDKTANPFINAGPDADKVVISGAEFSHGDTVDRFTVAKEISVDFSKVKFLAPGIYRYVITENKLDDTVSVKEDITIDETPRYLDVYVVNGENGLEIANCVLLTDAGRPDDKGKYQVEKSAGYVNKYKTYDLSLTKIVTGDMADLTERFDFTVEFTGPANATFTYAIGEETETQEITLDEEGNAILTNGVQLNNYTGALLVKGLPSNVTYKITENIDAKEGYTTTYVIDEKEPVTGTGFWTAETMGKNNHAVTFTNNREAITPTGIILNIMPYVLMVALAAVLGFLFLRRRKHSL